MIGLTNNTPLLLGQFFNAEVAELDACAVAEEADVAGLVGQAWVFLQRRRIFGSIEVGIDDDVAVEDDADVAAVSAEAVADLSR